MVVERSQPRQRSVLARLLRPDDVPTWGQDPGEWDPEAVKATKPMMDRIFGPRRYFRVRTTGWENLPESPVMLVSNHSGGTTLVDALGFGWSWIDHFGTTRPLHAMVHDLLLVNRVTGRPLSRVGALRACRANAQRALGEYGRDLVVYPGGDLDTWRPFSQRYQVCFSGRKGYARLALELGVPIVPVAHAGAHESLVVIATGRRIAKAFGLHRLARADVWPVHLSLPWGLAVGPVPHLPVPVRFDYRIGPPVELPESHLPGTRPSDSAIEAYDERVREALQAELDRLRESRRRFFRHVVERLSAR